MASEAELECEIARARKIAAEAVGRYWDVRVPAGVGAA
jgi:hypothetical protein